ncbi:MAG TPA: hypothetical protein VK509_25810, partial [Polyangiales bacterium]|nr:hypothetical protein [Polyangiales bacterium]
SLIPGADEPLVPRWRISAGDVGPEVSDRGLFWAQSGHLLRQVIAEYASDPIQGATGGPCFGDMTCAADSLGGGDSHACVDTLCGAAPFVPPSPCDDVQCDDGFACDQGACLRLWSGLGCEQAAPVRPSCGLAAKGCEQGLVCHVDGSCIEPGKCDRFGRATLAEVGDVRTLTVTADRVYALNAGTEDDLGNHRGDGSIISVPIAGGSVQQLVVDLDRPGSLAVDATRVIWNQGVSNAGELWSADRTDGGNPLLMSTAEGLAWVQDATHVYFASRTADGFEDMARIAKGTTTVEPVADGAWQWSKSFAIDSTSLYVSGGGAEPNVFPLAGGAGTQTLWLDGEMALGRDSVLFSGQDSVYIAISPKTGGGYVWLTPAAGNGLLFNMHPYRDHVYYWAVLEGQQGELRRAPLEPGSEEVLAIAPEPHVLSSSRVAIDVSDQGLFWVQREHIIRQVLDDYAAGPTPAQGAAGGPCFGDLSCAAGLSCIDTVCR